MIKLRSACSPAPNRTQVSLEAESAGAAGRDRYPSLANQSKRPIADVDEISKWVELLIVVGFPRLVLPLAQLVLHLQETVRAEPVGLAIFQLSLQKEKN